MWCAFTATYSRPFGSGHGRNTWRCNGINQACSNESPSSFVLQDNSGQQAERQSWAASVRSRTGRRKHRVWEPEVLNPPLCWQTYPWYWSIPKGQEALVLWQDQLAVSSVKALELYNLAVIHSLVQRAIAVKGLSTCFGEPKLTTVWKLQQKMLQ